MINENIRPYEISIWTLQDDFIAILKPFGFETKGQTQNTKMGLKDDGENIITFSIPMYLFQNNKYIENPNWFNITNGNLITSLRKIKVIFNKGEDNEQIFEFIITKVTESHEGFEKICEVECEGLAFHELGRQGYKIVLSAEEFDSDYLAWQENNEGVEAPVPNINYWCDKILQDSNWEYEIQMNWMPYKNMVLDSSKVYKDAFVSSWDIQANNSLIPARVEPPTERYAIIDESESNRYNLLQSVAEQFQVFCKFVYEYDDNYHIVNRKVIFYNNFNADETGFIDLTYGYDAKNLSREIDGVDLVSKMYIKPLNDSGLLTGQISISESDANKSLEDYILNFDYLYQIGTISEEQYAEIEPFEEQMRIINLAMIELANEKIQLEEELPIQQAKKQTAEDSIPYDKEGYTNANQLYNRITNNTGVIHITNTNPKSYFLIKDLDDDSGYYVNLEIEGIIPESIHLYYNYNTSSRTFSDEITTYTRTKDEFGNVVKLSNISKPGDSSRIYAIFDYHPILYYDKIKNVWEKKQLSDQADYDLASQEVLRIETRLEEIETLNKNYLIEKQQLLIAFEKIMKTALREGNWQPEDNYVNYKKTYLESYNLTATSVLNNSLASFGWDNKPFPGEGLNYYYNGIEKTKIYYPCIDLSSLMPLFSEDNFRNFGCFVYEDADYGVLNDPRAYQYFPFSSRCKFAFIRQGLVVKPVLMLTDIYSFDNFHNLQTRAWLGNVNFSMTNNIVTAEYDKKVTTLDWINNPENYEIVYPRFQINSTKFLMNDVNLTISRNNELLELYNNYYINFRENRYYVTIKPDYLFSTGSLAGTYKINYNISTAAESIYLDGLKILQENAYPKVSYSITPLMLKKNFIKELYNKIGTLVHINDEELKFQNVMGYISELKLDLDHPWQDEIVIKNYRTKFEDLFSTIVAQTEEIKKNSQLLSLANNLFLESGDLNIPFLQDKLFDESFQRSVSDNATIVASNLKATTASNKAILAASNALKIIDGDIGLAFPASDAIENIELNREKGLLIEGFLDDNKTVEGRFRVTNGAMGFFKNQGDAEEAMLYFDSPTGNLALAGTIYAKNGWFGDGVNGWVISQGKVIDEIFYQGGLLYSMNHQAIFSAGDDFSGPTIALFDSLNNPVLFFGDGNLSLRGSITATSFELASGVTISQSSVEGLTSDLTTLQNNINNTMAISATVTYSTSSQGTDYNYSDISWQSSIPATTAAKPYLWTRTITNYATANNTSTAYSVSRMGQNGINGTNGTDGRDGISVTAITILYYLKSDTTSPGKPSSKITTTSNISSLWTTAVPNYVSDYYYFRCEQYEWSNNTITWSTPYLDYGITAANQTATSASTTATNAANAISSITTNGLSSGVWNNVDYGVILGNTSTSKPMLIGSNSGITIAKTATASDGSAIVLDSSGIALNGTTISITTSGTTTNVVSLNSSGITIGSSGTVDIGSGIFKINAGNGSNVFKVDSSATLTSYKIYIADNNSWASATKGLCYSDSNGLKIKGNIEATSGSIGGWTIESNYLHSGSSTTYTALSTDTTKAAFWAGAATYSNAPFYITHTGELHASNATIKGRLSSTYGNYTLVIDNSSISLFPSSSVDPYCSLSFTTQTINNYTYGGVSLGGTTAGSIGLYNRNLFLDFDELYINNNGYTPYVGYTGIIYYLDEYEVTQSLQFVSGICIGH